MRPSTQRGSALILAMIVVMVVAVIGVGMVRYGAREVAGAAAGARHQSLAACADAARELLLSRFHALGASPTSLQAINVPMDGPAASASTWAIGGHVDITGTITGPTGQVQVTQVVLLPDAAFGPSNRARDLSNVISVAGQGGRPLKVVVHCQDHGSTTDPTSGRQLEVEFGVRFGL